MLGGRLAPVLNTDLPALLGRRTTSGLRRGADAARAGRLQISFLRHMLPIIADTCAMAIEGGARSPASGWRLAGPMAGSTVDTDEARSLMRLGAMVGAIIDLLDRIDDLVGAQRDAGEIAIGFHPHPGLLNRHRRSVALLSMRSPRQPRPGAPVRRAYHDKDFRQMQSETDAVDHLILFNLAC